VILDEASSEIYYAQLVEEESSLTVMAGLKEVIQSKGVFCYTAIAAVTSGSLPRREASLELKNSLQVVNTAASSHGCIVMTRLSLLQRTTNGVSVFAEESPQKRLISRPMERRCHWMLLTSPFPDQHTTRCSIRSSVHAFYTVIG
jgi:hypothetical protein